MKANLEHYGPYLLYEEHLRAGSHQRVFGSLPQFPHIVADVAASEILKLLTGFSAPTTYGRMFTFNFLTLTTEFQEILKLPRCPACGEPSKHLPMMKPWSE
jgi:bacteriocin biosynthesis cyclodehydratase domain-containing protein